MTDKSRATVLCAASLLMVLEDSKVVTKGVMEAFTDLVSERDAIIAGLVEGLRDLDSLEIPPHASQLINQLLEKALDRLVYGMPPLGEAHRESWGSSRPREEGSHD